ncbi:MAG: hypothetical protein K2I14_08150, partial [Eubacterium sp.]|nr:hypothetical protein [Eubacterium sp.]
MKKIVRVLAIVLIGISISGCSVQNYEEDHSNDSSIDFSQDSELVSETAVSEITEYSKYPNNLTSYNLSELGDFVVLTGTNSELDYVGYDYAFTKIQVLNSLYND